MLFKRVLTDFQQCCLLQGTRLNTVKKFVKLADTFAADVPMSIRHPRLQHSKGMLTSRDLFPASWITWFIVGHAPNVHRQ